MATYCRVTQILDPYLPESVTDAIYDRTVDALRGTANALSAYETLHLPTGTLLDVVMGDPASASRWQLTLGAADPDFPELEVAALASAAGAAVRHWLKVGGY